MTSNRHDIQDRLTESLQRHAAPVTAGPGLAQAAHRRALRLRLRRRITAGVACLVVLAVGVPIGYNVFGGAAKTEIAPVKTQTAEPRPTPSETQALVVTPSPRASRQPEHTTPPPDRTEKKPERKTPVRITIDLDSLPAGDAPKVPWYTEGVIHDGDREITVPGLSPGSMVGFAQAGDGFLVEDSADESTWRTRLKNADGKVIKTLDNGGAVASADGRLLAWAEAGPDENSSAATLVVADARTGEELHRKLFDQFDPHPVAFLGGTVVWDTDSGDGGVVGLWDPESGKVSTIEGLGRSWDVHGQVLLANTVFDPDRPCPGLIDHARGNRKLWVKCDGELNAISADGRYVFGSRPSSNVEVFDATNGNLLLEVTAGPDIGNWAAEPNGDLLFHVHTEQQQALVRCTLDGQCERATEILPFERLSTTLALPMPW